MAADTDLDLAMAVAATVAQDSDDDDFQQCGKQLALNRQQLLMGSSASMRLDRGPAKRGPSSEVRSQAKAKTRKCPDAGASLQKKTLAGCNEREKGEQMNRKKSGSRKAVMKASRNVAERMVMEDAELQIGHSTGQKSGLQARLEMKCTASTMRSTSFFASSPPATSFQQYVPVTGSSSEAACSRAESLSEIQESQSTLLVSNDTQLNALLSLCSKAARELDEPTRAEKSNAADSPIELPGALFGNDVFRVGNVPSDLSLESLVSDGNEGSVVSDGDDITSLLTQVSSPKTIAEPRGAPSLARSALRDISNNCAAIKSGKGQVHAEPKGEQVGIKYVQSSDFTPECPICQLQLGSLPSDELEAHTNACLDKLDEEEQRKRHQTLSDVGMAPVLEWLENLNLSKYADLFVKEEVDWDTLQWLKDEDLQNLGITALGPRRKIISSIEILKSAKSTTTPLEGKVGELDKNSVSSSTTTRITDFFIQTGKATAKAKPTTSLHKSTETASTKCIPSGPEKRRKLPRRASPPVQPWMCIPGTAFRVDAFRHLTTDCSHWFLTHFHADHYQGLTKGFRHGKIYCSAITAALVNMQLGVPLAYIEVLQLNEEVMIDGVRVTFIDANHCPGSVMILFEPPNGERVLHTGDFRYCTKMANETVIQSKRIHTLILDTTYCDPQYDFPEQEAAVQFVIEAIQAEAFNPKTLFLIGTYTIGKERVFLEVARTLQKKVYVGAAKRRLLTCLSLHEDEMMWLTCNDRESQIHVVPLWSIASFKRMASISRHYHLQYNSVVAFSLTGWNFARDKKRFTGRRKQQGTIVRYEVPYSEHCSFAELQQFIGLVKPTTIIPSVVQQEAADVLVSRLQSIGPA